MQNVWVNVLTKLRLKYKNLQILNKSLKILKNVEDIQGLIIPQCICTTSWQRGASTALDWTVSRHQSWKQQPFLSTLAQPGYNASTVWTTFQLLESAKITADQYIFGSMKVVQLGEKWDNQEGAKYQENYVQQSVTQPLGNWSRYFKRET